MNISRFFFITMFILLVLFVLALPKPEIKQELVNADLPWNISLHDDGSSEVFGLQLGSSTLKDAVNRFHEPEGIAIYKGEQSSSLEAYLGTVKLGPLEAKLVLTLEASAENIEQMLLRARGRAMSGSEDKKIELASEDMSLALARKISGITFIPKYAGLDEDYFIKRFGQPHAWLRMGKKSVQYFYPDRGLSITIDADGKEILQYSHPARFSMPTEAVITENQALRTS